MSELRHFTAKELCTLRKLRSLPEPVPYSAIAERLGRSRFSLIGAMRQPPKTTEDDRQQRRERLVSEFEEIKSIREIARRRGVSHVSIINMLDRAADDLRGMVVVSSYPSSLYEQRLKNWKRFQTDALADGAKPRTEVLWLNPRAFEALEEHTFPPLLRVAAS